jgi:hypothetical protein
MFSFSLSFSKPRLISIVLLLAILVISLFFSSYSEGMTGEAPKGEAPTGEAPKGEAPTVSEAPKGEAPTISDAVKTINKDAPTANSSAVAGVLMGKNDSIKPADVISLGTLSVSDITGVLQNNPGVQKMINNKL